MLEPTAPLPPTSPAGPPLHHSVTHSRADVASSPHSGRRSRAGDAVGRRGSAPPQARDAAGSAVALARGWLSWLADRLVSCPWSLVVAPVARSPATGSLLLALLAPSGLAPVLPDATDATHLVDGC